MRPIRQFIPISARRYAAMALIALIAAIMVTGRSAVTAHPAGTPPVRAVILAVQRDHRLHVFDAATLAPLGTAVVFNLADSVEARPDGGMLFIRQAETPDGNGCCALFALDLVTTELCRLTFPAIHAVPLTDNGRVFTQRGNVGIESFDAGSLQPLPTIPAPGGYSLFPSYDGRWLFGANLFREATLDLIDVQAGALVRRLPVVLPGTDGSTAPTWFTGVWLDGGFYLYATNDVGAYLWTVGTETTDLGPPSPITAGGIGLPSAARAGALSALIAADGRLYTYELRGWYPIARPLGSAGGGIYAIDPQTATIMAHLAPETDFAQVVASGDGKRLYGLDPGAQDGSLPVRLLALDSDSGATVAERTLPNDVWSIAWARIPENLIPHNELQPAPCSRSEPPPHPMPVIPPSAPLTPPGPPPSGRLPAQLRTN